MEKGSSFEIYGDGKLIYSSSEIVQKDELIDIIVNVENINSIKLVFKNQKGRYNDSYRTFALLDPELTI